MTSIKYDEIFSYFLGEITDYGLAAMNISDAYELMAEYLHKSISIPYVRRLFSSISAYDNVQFVEYEMNFENSENEDKDFVTIILSKAMLIQWLEPQVRSKVNIAQFLGGKEQSMYSQANHISELRGMLEDTQLELRKMIRDRGYINNEYLES